MSFQIVPMLFAAALGAVLLSLTTWALVLRPRNRTKAFLALADQLGAVATPLKEKRHGYIDSRGYQLYALARIRSLTGSRLVVPANGGSAEVEIDLIRTWTQRRNQHEWSTHLVFFLRHAGGPHIRLQRKASAFSILESEGLTVLAQKYSANFRFDPGTLLDETHLVATDSPRELQERFTEKRSRALNNATRKLHDLIGSETAACLLRSPTGIALMIKEPTEGLWENEAFAKALSLFRELAKPLIEPLVE